MKGGEWERHWVGERDGHAPEGRGAWKTGVGNPSCHLPLPPGFVLSDQLPPCGGVTGLFQGSPLEKKGLPLQAWLPRARGALMEDSASYMKINHSPAPAAGTEKPGVHEEFAWSKWRKWGSCYQKKR